MKWVALAALLISLLIIAIFLFAGSFLVVDDNLEHAELCHVLGGNQSRVLFGASLYEQGLCDRLVFIGGKEGGSQSYASRQEALAIDHGVPEADIMIDETDVFSTFAEIGRLAEVIKKSRPPAATVTYVTDPFHTRRVRMVSRWILDDSIRVQMAPVPFDKSLSRRNWWENKRSRRMVCTEYVKMVFYWFRYRLPFRPLNNWLARFDKIND
jgi:uncharacterized SAM-binding protein YcdF (DUF218 family)